MLDTLKVGIPLTQSQHKRLRDAATNDDRWQWVLCNPATGELMFRRVRGLAKLDQNSFHRELCWDVPITWSEDCCLTLEFSLPKYWYGHNIRLLYDSLAPLRHLKKVLEAQLKFKGRACLPSVETWRVFRADVCYAWDFHGNQRLAQQVLDSLKRHHFPRKKPVIRPESIFFQGNTYSVKMYLKLPEFMAHDRRELLKQSAALEWVDWCEEAAKGVLRFEVTLRRRYLKRQGINTVGDLLKDSWAIESLPNALPEDPLELYATLFAISNYWLNQQGVDSDALFANPDSYMRQWENQHPIYDGLTIVAPLLNIEIGDRQIAYPGGELIFHKSSRPIKLLQYFLEKFVGQDVGMQPFDEIEVKLQETYKPVKAARLSSFWLYVQKVGSEKAKESFGRDSYYYNKRELKKAGISLVEPPKGNVVNLDDFRFVIPNHYAVNRVDDSRDTENLLNLRKAENA